jgi:hypothetical protein
MKYQCIIGFVSIEHSTTISYWLYLSISNEIHTHFVYSILWTYSVMWKSYDRRNLVKCYLITFSWHASNLMYRLSYESWARSLLNTSSYYNVSIRRNYESMYMRRTTCWTCIIVTSIYSMSMSRYNDRKNGSYIRDVSYFTQSKHICDKTSFSCLFFFRV